MPEWAVIGENVYRFEDCCQVYALRDGSRALLIDLGSGAALDHLAEIGIESVAGIYFTHAHRDQCQGLHRVGDIPCHFPPGAEPLFDPARRPDFTRLAPGHLAYPCQFHPPHPFANAACDLQHRQLIPFGAFDLRPVAAPGHIDHHHAFAVESPDGLYLFCGDAIRSRGKVHEPFCLETDHYTGAGARLAAATLCELRNLRADKLCPSHGPVTELAVWDAFDETIDRLRRLADLKDTIVPRRPAVRRLIRPVPNQMHRVSEHLWCWNNSYFVLSDDGPVLMVDVQTKLPPLFWEQYAETFGDRPVEVVLVTHYHCDHVIGVEDLRGHHPLECWVHERLVDIVERPYDFPRPWLHNDPAKVDRPLAEGELVKWREYELTAWWFPGQTDYHACYATEIDGHAALLAGDNFYPAQQWGGTGGLCGYNGGHPDLWRHSAELVLELEPDWILSSHLQPFPYCRADFEAVIDWSERVKALMVDLTPDGNLERHHDPNYLWVKPYVQPALDLNPLTLMVRNTSPSPMDLAVKCRLPDDLELTADDRLTDTIPPGESRGYGFNVLAPADLGGMRMITFDVTVDGERWGECVECYLRGAGQYHE